MEKQLTERDVKRGYWLEGAGVFQKPEDARRFINRCEIVELRENKYKHDMYELFEAFNFTANGPRKNNKVSYVTFEDINFSMELEEKETKERFVLLFRTRYGAAYHLYKIRYINEWETKIDITDEQKARLLDIYGAAYDFELDVDGRAMELVESTLEALGVDTGFLEELDVERESEE